MLGLINAVTATFGAIDRYVKQGLVMANRFLTPPKLSHPAQGSAEFDGAADRVLIPNLGITGGQARTITAWVYLDTSTSDMGVVALGEKATGKKYTFKVTSANDLRIEIEGTGYTSSLSLNDDEWHHVAITQSGANLNTAVLYLDGSSENSTTSATTNTNEIGENYIGRAPESGTFLDGNLANVAIWNRALSSDEINSVMWKGYESLTSGEKNGLQAWYKLEESELLSGDDTATLETYAAAKGLTFEGKTCLQNALNAFPDITDARLYSANYDIRVSADGGSIEALSCVETELNALL